MNCLSRVGMLFVVAAAVLACTAASADIYVSGGGLDDPGNGTAGAPYRTITYALENLGAETVIRVGAGLYSDAVWEEFPLSVPAGVSIVGTMGSEKNATDSAVLDAGGLNAVSLATTPAGTTGLVKDLVFNNFRTAIVFTGWRGEVDGCYFTNAAAVAATATLLHIGPGATSFTLRNSTVTQVINTSAPYLIWVEEAGISGTFTIDNCVFSDIKGGSPGGRGFIGTGRSASAATVIRNSIFDTFVFTANNNNEAGMIVPFGGTFLFEGNIVRNINLNTPIVNPNRVGGTPTVRNCLFYNITNGGWGPVNSAYSNSLAVYNSTFHGCSAVTNNTGGCNIYNSTVSSCTRVNGHATNPITGLRYVNIFETPTVGPYNPDNSSNITDYDPKYVNTDTNDYRLRGNSLLVDAGNNDYVTWTYPNPEDPENPLPPVDLDGNPRVMDGNFDAVETVDIGAYEFGPADDPTFSVFPFFDVFEGTTVNVPVSIVPEAGGSVTANVTYDAGLSGSASLVIADGSGPQNLAVQVAAGTGTATGSAMDIAITDAASVVEPAWCTVRSFPKTVTITGAPTLFLAPDGSADLPVKLMSSALAAPADINITVGTPAGAGSNTIAWAGGAKIAQGAAQSQGYLSIDANEGVNTISLTVDGGFVFTESGTATFDLQVVCLSSPIYVSGGGSDTEGLGTAGSPFRSITKALTFVPDVMEIQVGHGLYDSENGEVFRLVVPAGVSITGTMGAGRHEDDSSVIDGGGAKEIMRLNTTAAGTTGLIKNLVFKNFLTAINFTGWRGAVDGCYFTASASGATTGMLLYSAGGATDFTLRNCTATQMTNTAAPYLIWVEEAGITGSFTIDNCVFSDIRGGAPGGRGFIGNGRFANSSFVIRNSIFDTFVFTASSGTEAGMIIPFYGTFLFEGNIVRNIDLNTPIVNPNRVGGTPTVRNCLFYNITNGTWGPVNSYGSLAVYNSTFHNCSAVTNAFGVRNIYNSSISNCNRVNGHATDARVQLHTCNVFGTEFGPYDVDNSTAITALDPGYEDAAAEDFRLKRKSDLVDAGNNDYVTWTLPKDLDGNERIVDGKSTGTPTVDIGAYEVQLGWPIPGDANGDCKVNILDLIFVRNRLNQDVGTGDNWQADVNQDTKINILDLIFVRNRLNTTCPPE